MGIATVGNFIKEEAMTKDELKRTVEGKREALRQYREQAEAEIKRREAEIAAFEAQQPDVAD
jgi:hypothetical protein